jgi:hypothetical protein
MVMVPYLRVGSPGVCFLGKGRRFFVERIAWKEL